MKKVETTNTEIVSDVIIKTFKRQNYLTELKKLQSQNEEWFYSTDVVTKRIRELNKEYDQDGTLAYEKMLKILKKRKYPKDVFEKIAEKLKTEIVVEFYKDEIIKKEKEEKIPTKNKHSKVKEALISLNIDEHLFSHLISEIDNFPEISKKLTSLSIEVQKYIVDIAGFTWFEYGNPNVEILKYALSLGQITLETINKNKRTNEIEMIAAKTGNFSDKNTFKNFSSNLRKIFIQNNPERIISEINEKNWDTKSITRYDLTDEEFKIYEKAIEEKQIELIKRDPTLIKNMKNPSQLVRNYAVNAFMRKYSRTI